MEWDEAIKFSFICIGIAVEALVEAIKYVCCDKKVFIFIRKLRLRQFHVSSFQ